MIGAAFQCFIKAAQEGKVRVWYGLGCYLLICSVFVCCMFLRSFTLLSVFFFFIIFFIVVIDCIQPVHSTRVYSLSECSN